MSITATDTRISLDKASPLTIISGHYGVGKTNLSLNLAYRWLQYYPTCTLIDLDIVNPYFRSSDYSAWLAAKGIKLLGPTLAGSTLDTPALAAGIDEAIQMASADHPVLIDVGGDPDGARALARYQNSVSHQDYRLIYVSNFHRPEVATVEKSLQLLRAIEAQSQLKAQAIIGNDHLKEFSTVEQIIANLPLLIELCSAAELPLLAITAPHNIAIDLEKALADYVDKYPEAALLLEGLPVIAMRKMVATSWEEHELD